MYAHQHSTFRSGTPALAAQRTSGWRQAQVHVSHTPRDPLLEPRPGASQFFRDEAIVEDPFFHSHLADTRRHKCLQRVAKTDLISRSGGAPSTCVASMRMTHVTGEVKKFHPA